MSILNGIGPYIEVSASFIAEAQTEKIKRVFKRSRPRPRNRAMGFRGEKPKTKTDWRNPWA